MAHINANEHRRKFSNFLGQRDSIKIHRHFCINLPHQVGEHTHLGQAPLDVALQHKLRDDACSVQELFDILLLIRSVEKNKANLKGRILCGLIVWHVSKQTRLLNAVNHATALTSCKIPVQAIVNQLVLVGDLDPHDLIGLVTVAHIWELHAEIITCFGQHLADLYYEIIVL